MSQVHGEADYRARVALYDAAHGTLDGLLPAEAVDLMVAAYRRVARNTVVSPSTAEQAIDAWPKLADGSPAFIGRRVVAQVDGRQVVVAISHFDPPDGPLDENALTFVERADGQGTICVLSRELSPRGGAA